MGIQSISMQLKLSIVLTKAHGRTFRIDVYKNFEHIAAAVDDDIEVDVTDSDVIRIVATGKESGTLVSDSGEILEDISLRITSIVLGGVKISDHYSVVGVFDLAGNQLSTVASLFVDGELIIKIDDLVKAHFDYNGVPMLSLATIADEVFGKTQDSSLTYNK